MEKTKHVLDSLAAVKRHYEDFEPSTELVPEEECDTLLLFLPGFKKTQLRVQVTTNRKLKISGQRPVEGEKWSRFQKEFQIPENCDTDGISAKFENDILYIRQPKVITPVITVPKTESLKTDHKPTKEEQTQPDRKNESQNKAAILEKKSDESEKIGKITSEIKDEKVSGNGNYNKVSSCLIMELKKRRKIFYMSLVVLFLALVLGFYATSWKKTQVI